MGFSLCALCDLCGEYRIQCLLSTFLEVSWRPDCFVKKKFKKKVDNPGNLYYYIVIDRTVGHFLLLAAGGQSLMKEE
jgi:hypothetical protein